VGDRSANLFVEVDDRVQGEVRAILRDHPTLIDARGSRSGADPFVIGMASVNRAWSSRKSVAAARSTHGFPVCAHRGIQCVNLLAVIRAEGWTFT
jgi:hypothetical protein